MRDGNNFDVGGSKRKEKSILRDTSTFLTLCRRRQSVLSRQKRLAAELTRHLQHTLPYHVCLLLTLHAEPSPKRVAANHKRTRRKRPTRRRNRLEQTESSKMICRRCIRSLQPHKQPRAARTNNKSGRRTCSRLPDHDRRRSPLFFCLFCTFPLTQTLAKPGVGKR